MGEIVREVRIKPRGAIMAGGATPMERSAGFSNPPGEPAIFQPARQARRRSMAPHHRRRRWLAAVALVALALVAILSVAAGGGSVHAPSVASPAGAGFFDRIRELADSAAGSLAAHETAAENAAINRTLAYTPYVRVAGSQHREIALTFDDGPGPYTPQILGILERRDVAATFFEVGALERYFFGSTAAIVADGDAIGDHTEGHAAMSRLSAGGQRSQLLSDAAAVERRGAHFPRLFRPPYGMWNQATLALLRRYRMLMVLWTVDTGDYRRPGVKAIVRAALAGARPGAIVLLHDAGGDRSQTVKALPRIIAGLRRRGYRLVTVPRLLLDNPAPRVQNIAAVIGTGG